MNFIEFQKFCAENQFTFFTIRDMKILFNKYSEEYLRLKLNRWEKKGHIRTLKKGLYRITGMPVDEFEIAAHLITPSYISLETALSHYSIIPDISSQVSSVTTKNTRYFTIDKIQYRYYHIKTDIFSDYRALMDGRDGIFIASPEKAILDFFYFRKPEKDDQFFERINAEIFKNIDIKKMEKIAKKFPGNRASNIAQLINHLKYVINR